MAIRKFRKLMKPIVWLVSICFFISAGALIISQFENTQNPNIAFELNGKKIDRFDVERVIVQVSRNFDREKEDYSRIVGLDEFIKSKILLEIGDKLKIKVSNSEINKELDAIKAQFKDKNQYKSAIAAQGFTTATLKKEIKNSLRTRKIVENILSNTNITEKEVNGYYELLKNSVYKDKKIEEVKQSIEQILKNKKVEQEITKAIIEGKNTLKLEKVTDNLKKYTETVEFEFEGIKVTNVEFARKILDINIEDIEEAKKQARLDLEREIKFIKALENRGVTAKDNLTLASKLNELVEKFYIKSLNELKYTDEDLKNYYIANKEKYNIEKSAVSDLAIATFMPSELDKERARKQAEEILKEVTPENFAENAEKYSKDPSSKNGGYLGTFKKGDMVKTFEDAAFAGKEGEVYSEVVETEFGYHIIFVSEKNDEEGTVAASHILIIPEVSIETMNAQKVEIENIVKELNDNKITFENLKTDKNKNKYFQFVEENINMSEDGYISGLGYSKEVTEQIFASKIGKAALIDNGESYIVYRKKSQIEAKKVKLEDVKDQVKSDYLAQEIQKIMAKIEETIK